MKKDVRLYIDDIKESIDLIRKYSSGVELADLAEDTMLLDSIVRRLMIIGEAVKKIPDEIRDLEPAIPWKSIAGTRDILVHNYDAIKPEQVMTILTEDLPALAAHIESLGKKLN